MKSSNRFKSLLATAAVLIMTWSCAATCHAWSLAVEPVEGVLLLKNSNLLRGKIQKVGKHYHVHLNNGKLQIREQQVETVCEDFEAAYQYRRQQRGGSSADTHIELAGWCLRHDLFEHADAELKEAEAIDSDHRRLGLLRRQLTQSRQMAAREQLQVTAQVDQVEPEPFDPAELDKAPKWARALFVRQIQPLIVHSCATGGCHQAGDGGEFQINRLAIDGAGHPGVTLRNLAQTLKRVNFDAADQSDLITKASQAHGGVKMSEPLPQHKLHVLKIWAEQLAFAHQQDTALRTVPTIAEAPITPTLQLNPPQLATHLPPKQRQPTPQPPEGVRTASYQPTDPFDPAMFNDRYGSEQTAVQPQVEPVTVEPVSPPTTSSVPHLLVPSDPQPTPLPPTE